MVFENGALSLMIVHRCTGADADSNKQGYAADEFINGQTLCRVRQTINSNIYYTVIISLAKNWRAQMRTPALNPGSRALKCN